MIDHQKPREMKKSWFFDKKGNVKWIENEVKKTETGAVPSNVGFTKTSGSKNSVKTELKKAA